MKKIIVHSKKYGVKEILVDDCDYEWLLKFRWSIYTNQRNFYARKTKPLAWRKGGKDYMHRMILGVTNPKIYIDHKDHNGLNNQRSNIRQCVHRQNCRNHRSEQTSTSKYIGVCFSSERMKWVAQIGHMGQTIPLGRYHSEIEAAKVRDKKAIELFGEFANLNFPL